MLHRPERFVHTLLPASTATLLALLALLATPAEARCRLERVTKTVEEVNPFGFTELEDGAAAYELARRSIRCKRTRTTGALVHAVTGRTMELRADDLRCGTFVADNWGPQLKDAQSLCDSLLGPDNDEIGTYWLAITTTPMSRHHNLLSVRMDFTGNTGGAHDHAHVLLRTFDMRTRKPLKLDAIVGAEQAAELLKEARQRFNEDPRAAEYTFDTEAFAFEVDSEGDVIIHFAHGHKVEAARGTALEYDITRLPGQLEEPAPPARKPGKR